METADALTTKILLVCVADGCEEIQTKTGNGRLRTGPRRSRYVVQFRAVATRHTRLAK